MKKKNYSRLLLCLEPLEQRIAPALLVVGGNLLGGSGNPTTGETSIGENTLSIIKVISGQAIAWFDGRNLTGVSVGPNTSLELKGDVFGDVVANLTAAGRLSDSDNNPLNGEDGAALLPNNIIGIKTSALSDEPGSIGNIITGGSVSKLSINGFLSGVYAGNGAFRTDPGDGDLPAIPSRVGSGGIINVDLGGIDSNPIEPGPQAFFDLSEANAITQSGASIKIATIQKADELQMFAGDGGARLPGGSIQNVTIVSGLSTFGGPTFHLYAGDGGSGTSGGAGGAVDHIVDTGSVGTALIRAGAGGNGSTGAGGAGGSISQLDLESGGTAYTLTAGNGGNGVSGGAGGSVTFTNAASNSHNGGLIVSGDFTGDGVKDVLLIDRSTGNMVLEENNGNNAGFTPVVQNTVNGKPVYLIPSLGTNPVDAVAVHFNPDATVNPKFADIVGGDAYLDVVVAYKDSSNVGVFLNKDSHGHFLNNSTFHSVIEPPADILKNFTAGAGLSPRQIVVGDFFDTHVPDVVVMGDDQNHSLAGLLTGKQDTTSHVFSLVPTGEPNKFPETFGLGVSLVGKDGGAPLLAFQSGDVLSLKATNNENEPVFTPTNRASLGIGLVNLDINEAGDQLLALQGHDQMLELFNLAPSGALTPQANVDISGAAGRPLQARFGDDPGSAQDAIGVLYAVNSEARFDLYQGATAAGLALTQSLDAFTPLKNFVFLDDLGIAATSNTFGRFLFSADLNSFDEFTTPFAGKQLFAFGGNGGNGTTGAGGAGGAISSLNVDATDIHLQAGHGGDSDTSRAGAGGGISNPASFTPFASPTATVKPLALKPPQLIADVTLFIASGGGGEGAAGGNGGGISNVVTVGRDTDIIVRAGDGGDATAGTFNGGAGGGIDTVKYNLTLAPEIEKLEKGYDVTFVTGNGGTSVGGTGGAGGGMNGVSLTLDGADSTYDRPSANPPVSDRHLDSTVRIIMTAGDGGNGAKGGAGGGITQASSLSVFDQFTPQNEVIFNFVVADVQAGNGGAGSSGNGGAGGSITTAKFTGLTFFDRDSIESGDVPLTVTAGNGGDGSAKGGAGGTITGVTTHNALASDGGFIRGIQLEAAMLRAGDGGDGATSDGGVGGDVRNSAVAVAELVEVRSGDGGAGGAKGGAGGQIASDTLGSVFASILGVDVTSGAGGAGVTGGGAGGGIASIQLNAAHVGPGDAASLVAGAGGAASGANASGGNGGSISSITQAKDINSAISLLLAGNGGASPAGHGGNGGNVTSVNTVGYIGKPTDGLNRLGVFDNMPTPMEQGVFSGRGGAGATAGTAGSVSSIVAHQIAAIAAAPDAAGHFGVASKVSSVKADLIGYDLNANGVFNNILGNNSSPSLVKPIDGFILASVIQSVVGQRAGFVFNA